MHGPRVAITLARFFMMVWYQLLGMELVRLLRLQNFMDTSNGYFSVCTNRNYGMGSMPGTNGLCSQMRWNESEASIGRVLAIEVLHALATEGGHYTKGWSYWIPLMFGVLI